MRLLAQPGFSVLQPVQEQVKGASATMHMNAGSVELLGALLLLQTSRVSVWWSAGCSTEGAAANHWMPTTLTISTHLPTSGSQTITQGR